MDDTGYYSVEHVAFAVLRELDAETSTDVLLRRTTLPCATCIMTGT